MDELKKFFKDIERIADALELQNKSMADCSINENKDIRNEVVNDAVKEASSNSVVQIVEDQKIHPQVSTAIPVSNVVQSYTQERLAVAMGRALDMGKMTEIQNLLAQFSVNSLMELTPDKYNDLALKLREIGVEV